MNEVQAGSCKQHKGAFFIIGGQGRMTNNNLFVFFSSLSSNVLVLVTGLQEPAHQSSTSVSWIRTETG